MSDQPMSDIDAGRFWDDPGADPATTDLVAALESLGADAADDRSAPILTAGRRRRPIAAVLAAAAALLVVVSAVFVIAVVGGEDGVVVAAADGVAIVEDDGSTSSVRPGAELSHGTVVVVQGFVDVGDGRQGPGRYLVDDGRLVEVESSTDPMVTSTDPTATTVGGVAGSGSREDVEPESQSDDAGDVPTTDPVGDSGPVGTEPERIDSTTPSPTSETRPATTVVRDEPTTTAVERPVDTRPVTATTAPPVDRPATTAPADGAVEDRPATTPAPTRPATTVTERGTTTTTVAERGGVTTTTQSRRGDR